MYCDVKHVVAENSLVETNQGWERKENIGIMIVLAREQAILKNDLNSGL